jgi:hypothetical protein
MFAPPAAYREMRMADALQLVQAWLDDARFRQLSLTPRFGLALSYPSTDDPRVSQPPALETCAWRSIELGDGQGQGEGEVTYQVTAEGVPDTTTLTVVRLSRAEPKSFRTAAAKAVGVCRFTPRMADSAAAPTLVRQRISFLTGDAGTESTDPKISVEEPAPEPEPATTVRETGPPETFAVSEVTMGKEIGADKRVVSPTRTFGPKDTFYVSVATTGSAPSKTLRAKWTFEDGQTVKEDSASIAPTGPAVTEFHIMKASDWPPGRYKVEITVDGSATTKEFQVREK